MKLGSLPRIQIIIVLPSTLGNAKQAAQRSSNPDPAFGLRGIAQPAATLGRKRRLTVCVRVRVCVRRSHQGAGYQGPDEGRRDATA